MAYPRQIPLASSTLLLLATIACEAPEPDGPAPLECPATGAVLLEQVPLLEPEDGAGCEDSESWTAVADPANPTWTIEALPVWSFNNIVLRPYGEGVVLGDGNDLHVFEGDGSVRWERGAGAGLSWTNFQTTADSRFVIGSVPFGAGPQYRVLDSNGIEIWLRLLDAQAFSTPQLVVDGDELLVNLALIDQETFEWVFRIQRWSLTGAKLSEFDVPTEFFGNGWLAADGAGNIGLYDEDLVIYDASGNQLGVADLGNDFPFMLVASSDEGFFVVGGTENVAFVRSYAPDGTLRWSRGFGSAIGYDRVQSAAATPDGGVVVVGYENNIAETYPDSQFVGNSQPFVLALDSDGNPSWGERLATQGSALAVAVGFGGEVYVAGEAQDGVPSETTYPGELLWLRRYDP